MILRLIREPTRDGATLGSLYLNGHWECWTLEDALREQLGQPVADWKAPGVTAIPAGRYRVTVEPSPRFQRPLPRLHDVPGFSGILIHPGNDHEDTEGCLLVGRDRHQARVLQSKVAFEALYQQLRVAEGDIWIEIENPADLSVVAG